MSGSARVLKSAKVVSACTGVSRLLGFVRMILMARFFGTSLFVSAFFVAFSIPNMFRRLFGEGALSAAFVPLFTESIEKEGLEKANELASKVMTMLGTAMLAIILAGILFLTLWMDLLDPGLKTAAVLPLLRIMLPYMFFICMVALCMGILNSRRHFFTPAATPVLLNILWIGIMVLLCPRFTGDVEKQITALAWGILVAGLVQLLVQIPVMRKNGINLKLNFSWRDERVHKVLLLMGPAALGMGVFQINTAIGRILALVVDAQAPSALIYAELVVYLPLGLFATAWSTVLLPTFSTYAARDENVKMLATLNLGVRSLMFVMLPASVGLTILARTLVEALFQGGMFNVESTIYTSRALVFFAPGLVFFGLYKILVPVFYSRKDTSTPVRVALVQVFMNLLLMTVFIIWWPEGYKHAGIAFASVLSFAFSCYLLFALIHKRVGDPGWSEIGKSVGKSLALSLVMGGFVWFVDSWAAANTTIATFGRLLIGVLTGIIVYFLMSLVFCKNELNTLRSK